MRPFSLVALEMMALRRVAQDKLIDAAYSAAAGPIAPRDILYGHRPQRAERNLDMADCCGFTQKVLVGTLR